MSATQTAPAAKRKVMVEMSEQDYRTLQHSAKHNERTMSAHIRFLIRRELQTR